VRDSPSSGFFLFFLIIKKRKRKKKEGAKWRSCCRTLSAVVGRVNLPGQAFNLPFSATAAYDYETAAACVHRHASHGHDYTHTIDPDGASATQQKPSTPRAPFMWAPNVSHPSERSVGRSQDCSCSAACSPHPHEVSSRQQQDDSRPTLAVFAPHDVTRTKLPCSYYMR
jgi:hypothetical protein